MVWWRVILPFTFTSLTAVLCQDAISYAERDRYAPRWTGLQMSMSGTARSVRLSPSHVKTFNVFYLRFLMKHSRDGRLLHR
jgi:hypothetical protein